ncbi:hypothetical protein [Sphingomonas sp. 10B4]|uniref:hypothetical protein n=1 Tax=Sphingomonas sp. 10B4 TaxID=3048575 RepID=UPI002B23C582|nr:hypothetical protein [Sphingomonas sp. 10B4]
MRRGSKGIADFRLRLYWEQFRQIRLPVPPIEEQRTIAAEADAITKRAAGLTKLIEMSLDRLHERRQALIADAISGRINVTQAEKRKNAA